MRATALVVHVTESALREQRQALEEAGFDVVTASSFAEGSILLGQVRPDVLVAPVRLGTHNGIHLAWRSREVSERTRVVIVGYPDVGVERDATDAGALYLTESDVRTLVAAAVQIVRRPRGHTSARRAGGGRH